MTPLDRVHLVLGGEGEGTAPSAVGDSWDCCAGLESPRRDAAAAEASGGCSGGACLGMSAAVGARRRLHRLRLAVAAPALVQLVQAVAEGLLFLRCLRQALPLGLGDHPLNFAAAVVAAAASASGAAAGALQLLATWSWGSLAAGLAVLAHPVVHPAAAGNHLHRHPQAGVGKRGVSLAVPDQAA